MEISSTLISAASGILGVAVAFGGLKALVGRNTKDVNRLQQDIDTLDDEHEKRFVPKSECTLTHEGVKSAMSDLDESVKKQRNAQRRFENFALYQLTKDGMSLSEAQGVLENGGG
jgi:hypothetical protein